MVEKALEEQESLLGFELKTGITLEEESREKGKAKRKKLAAHLPREDVILEPESKCESCGGEKFRTIGEDISEVLEHIPESFKVIRYIRPRCACTTCDNIVQAYAPSKVIDKGIPGPGLLAHIFVQKFCNHLPAYRQSQIYSRDGVELSRSTISSWLGQGAKLLEPLADKIREYICAANQIHGDDTPVKVLDPGKGETKTGRIWVYVKDGRPSNDSSPVAACYFYHACYQRKSRQGEVFLWSREVTSDPSEDVGEEGTLGLQPTGANNIEEFTLWLHCLTAYSQMGAAQKSKCIEALERAKACVASDNPLFLLCSARLFEIQGRKDDALHFYTSAAACSVASASSHPLMRYHSPELYLGRW